MPNNPFDLPEIRYRLALFVSVKSALACARVSKAFSQDFAYPIWHTVDFDDHTTFVGLDSPSIDKNGHHIRTIKALKSQAQLDSLQYRGAYKLSSLTIHMSNDPLFQAGCYDLIRRNHATLNLLEIENADGASRVSPPFVFLDSLTSMANPSQSSCMRDLAIQWLTLTKESLITVLRCCPVLVHIDLWGTTVIRGRSSDNYQHTGVKTLLAMVGDTDMQSDSPLFVHFPNLTRWSTGHRSMPSEFPSQAVKDNVSRWCPRLTAIEVNSTPPLLLVHLITHVFTGLTCLTFDYAHISSDVVLAILRSPAGWTEIVTYIPQDGFYEAFEDSGVAEMTDHFRSSGWMLQMIPRLCHGLTTFQISTHEMDMDEVEKAPWTCKNLKHLAIRIQGLDTRDKIEAAIAGWKAGRKKKSDTTVDVSMEQGDSIEGRVTRFLLQFDNLSTIWLGSKKWVV